VGKVKMLYVLAAIVLGLLLILIVGVLIHPDDGKQPTGHPASKVIFADRPRR
jgi:hypothetical protein